MKAEKLLTVQIVPAQPGWEILSAVCGDSNSDGIKEFSPDPIIAWVIRVYRDKAGDYLGDHDSTVFSEPVTVEGISEGRTYRRPDRMIIQNDRIFSNEAEALVHFNERGREDQPISNRYRAETGGKKSFVKLLTTQVVPAQPGWEALKLVCGGANSEVVEKFAPNPIIGWVSRVYRDQAEDSSYDSLGCLEPVTIEGIVPITDLVYRRPDGRIVLTHDWTITDEADALALFNERSQQQAGQPFEMRD
jgi:hypothetical protein